MSSSEPRANWSEMWHEMLSVTGRGWQSGTWPFGDPGKPDFSFFRSTPDLPGVSQVMQQLLSQGQHWVSFAEQLRQLLSGSENLNSDEWHARIRYFIADAKAALNRDRGNSKVWIEGLQKGRDGLHMMREAVSHWQSLLPGAWQPEGNSLATTDSGFDQAVDGLADAWSSCAGFWNEAHLEAIDGLESRLHDAVEGENRIPNLQSLFDIWTGERERAYRGLLQRDDYIASFGRLCNAVTDLRLAVRHEQERLLTLLGLPTQTQYEELHQQYRQLAERLDGLERRRKD